MPSGFWRGSTVSDATASIFTPRPASTIDSPAATGTPAERAGRDPGAGDPAGQRATVNLNDALAWSAARWTADQAIAAGASVIYVEDLRTLEAKGMGRTLNTRLSQAVRGQIVDHIRHLAAEQGIAVVTVPARGTSKNCPRCLSPLRHCKAPDKPAVPGWKSARCPGCGWQGDRDQGAWQRITARGLAHQHKTSADRAAATMAIRAVDDGLEAAAVSRRLPGRTGRRPGRPGEGHHAPRPGDAGHPPRHGLQAAAASVRRDTPQRPGNCRARHTGTRT